MSWDLSCPDWKERLRDGRSLVPDLELDQYEADRAVAVFKKLRLADVPGTPTLAEAAGEWFIDIVRALFGSINPETRERAIRELFLLVPKKNSKTSYGALLMLAALLLNERPKAEFLMVAPVKETADLAFSQAAGAIALDPVLVKKFHVREHIKTIIHRETKAELCIVTFDPAVLTGKKVSGGALIDELHVCAKMSKASSAIRQLRGGMLPFPEAFLAFITTQSEEAPAGVFRAELSKARAIRDGTQEGFMLPVLYEFPEEIQTNKELWRDPKLWHMVTPNAGRSISIERLHQEFKTAEASGEQELRAWASQHLNIEIGLALMADRWAGADYWEQQAIENVSLEQVIELSEVIDIGIDGGGLDDLLGLAVLGRIPESRKWLLWTRAWAHPSVLERRKTEAPKFLDFEKDGHLVLVKKIGDDVDELAAICKEVYASGKLDKIGIDPAGIGAILDALIGEEAQVPEEQEEEDGKEQKIGLVEPDPEEEEDAPQIMEASGDYIPADKVIGISQGWKLGGPIKTTERKLAQGQLEHGGQRMMAWCVGNAKVEPRANGILITKQASGYAKIDPLMATFNAVSLMSMNPKPPAPKHQIFFF